MNATLEDAVREKMAVLDKQIRRRAFQAAGGYSLGLSGAVALYLFFPFALCRVGSVVLMIALIQMLSKIYHASRATLRSAPRLAVEPILEDLDKVEAQVQLMQSAIYNLPYLVGVNLFCMGLPGTGSAEAKAWLDCFFLVGTVLVFSGCYIVNQLTLRRELLPLLGELEKVLRQ